jgi:hypothetical protein
MAALRGLPTLLMLWVPKKVQPMETTMALMLLEHLMAESRGPLMVLTLLGIDIDGWQD